MRRILLTAVLAIAVSLPALVAAAAPPRPTGTYDVTPQTARAMYEAAPATPLVKLAQPRKVLVYGRVPTHPESVACCFKAMEILGQKTGAFEAVASGDPEMFSPENLKQFDVVLMNNTHERTPMLPWDFDDLSAEKQAAAKEREPLLTKSLVDFVASGKGLVGIHGATAIRDDLKELAEMYGGQIMGHRGGAWWVKTDEPDHPLCKPLGGGSFEVRDEIYVHRKPLTREPMGRESIRAMLSLDLSKMEDPKLREDGDYALSWIRTFGKGRVFYCTLGHAKTAYTNPAVMKHYLAGIQFAAGDLTADAAPK
ncbi:MAG TPA: ThuA domain-containing protein [Thermoguttaceae bacterium]|nr:ThuA domain-containing protein [Thermoguttaceae bacterium]